MYQEMSLKDALKKYIAGKKVLCLQIYEDGRIDANDLSDFLEGKQLHYLVDVPAVKNLDFEEAVQKMILQDKPKSPPTKPKATKRPANKKIDDELARKLLAEGKTQREMAETLGVKQSTMSIWVKNIRRTWKMAVSVAPVSIVIIPLVVADAIILQLPVTAADVVLRTAVCMKKESQERNRMKKNKGKR